MEREKLASRMGFILLSAGCAIGIGNVWRFPYITGMYGGELSSDDVLYYRCRLDAVFSLPCVLGYNLWSSFQPMGAGSAILDLEDFMVSNVILPIGSLVYLLFCVTKYGWGFDRYREEANIGEGLKVPEWLRIYVTYILPVLIVLLILQGWFG